MASLQTTEVNLRVFWIHGTNEVVAGEGDPNIDGDIAGNFFEAATLARTPREDLDVLATSDPTNGDLVTL